MERTGNVRQIHPRRDFSGNPVSLEPLHTVSDVANALGVTEYFVKQQCRKHLWPHRRLSRGQVGFTAADYAEVLDLTARPVEKDEPTGLAFAPRSVRRKAS